MLTLKLFQPDVGTVSSAPYMFYVSQKNDIIFQESTWHFCQEILLRWGGLEFAKKGGGIQREPYCFRSGHGNGYMSPTIQIVLTCTQVAPTLFADAVETYLHPIERAAGLDPTNIVRLGPHQVFLQADRHWASNALAMSIWLQLIRVTMKWRQRDGNWLSYVYANSYFNKLPSSTRLPRVWEILPELIAHDFKYWCGHPEWTAFCGVQSQIYNSASTNLLGSWMWKNVWSLK